MAIDGRHTIDSYLNHTEGIGPNNLTDFSVCLRFNVNYLKPEVSPLLSYSTYLSDNTLIIFLLRESGGSLLLVGSKCYNCKLEQVSTLGYNDSYNFSQIKFFRVLHPTELILQRYIKIGIMSV